MNDPAFYAPPRRVEQACTQRQSGSIPEQCGRMDMATDTLQRVISELEDRLITVMRPGGQEKANGAASVPHPGQPCALAESMHSNVDRVNRSVDAIRFILDRIEL